MSVVKTKCLIGSLFVALTAVLALAGAAHAQVKLTTTATTVGTDSSAVCIATNVSETSQSVAVILWTTEGREVKTCGSTRDWAPGRICVTQERSNTIAFCTVEIEAPGGKKSVHGLLAVKDASGTPILLLEARP